MPEEKDQKPDYISTVYSNLKQAYGDQFSKSEQEFRDKMSTDYEYRKTVHSNLKQAYGEDFKKDFPTFNFQLPSIPRPGETTVTPGVSDANLADKNRSQEISTSPNDQIKQLVPKFPEPYMTGGQKVKDANLVKDFENWNRINATKKTSKEALAERHPELLKKDIENNSKVAAKLFQGKAIGSDAVNFGKYLLELSEDNPEKYEEVVSRVANYGSSLTEKERFDLLNQANDYVAGKINADQSIYTSRGYNKKFEQYINISKKFEQIQNELNSYGDLSKLPEDKKLKLKSKIDLLNQEKEEFESDPSNMDAVQKFTSIYEDQEAYVKAQNKILQDSPAMLKKQAEQFNLKLQEEGLEKGKFVPGIHDYMTNEVAGNMWNTVVNAATNVLELTKDAGEKFVEYSTLGMLPTNKYSINDRVMDGLKSLVDTHVKATVSDTDMFDDKGNLRSYRILPNVAKVATDMAIQLTPVGRLGKAAQAARLGKFADDAALISSNFLTQYGNYKEEGRAQGMTEEQSELYGLAQGTVNSLLQVVSPNKEIRGIVPKEKFLDLAKRYAEQGAGAFTKKEAFQKMTSEILDISMGSLSETVKENLQEDLESIAEKVINVGFNASNKSLKLDESVSSKELKENLILTTLLTGPVSAVGRARSQSQMTDGATYELLKNYEESQQILNDMKEAGKLSDEQFDRVSSQLESTKELFNKIPDNYSETSKLNIIPFLREKAALEERVKRQDATFSLRDNKKLEDINKTLEAFNEKESTEPVEAEQKREGEKVSENKEPEVKYEPLTEKEIGGLKVNSDVFVDDLGQTVPAKINQVMANGEVLLDLSNGKRKIVLDKSLVKPVEEPKIDIGAELSEDVIKGAQEEDITNQPQQQLSKEEKGTEAWALAIKNRLGKVFKGSDVAFTQKEFDDAAKKSEHPNAINGNAFYDRATNKIYINPKKFKKDTPVHEFGHIWTDVLKQSNTDAYEKVIDATKTSDVYQQIKNNDNYKHLSDNDIAEEAFVTALGKKGVDVFSDLAERNKFNEVVSDMWDALKSTLGLDANFKLNDNTPFSKIVDLAAKDLGKNKSIQLKRTEEEGIKEQNESINEVASIAKEYAKSKGIKGYSVPEKTIQLDEDNSKKIADAFVEMKNEPENPKVKSAYKKLAEETIDQGKFILDKGYKVEIFEGTGEPYKNSTEMMNDIRDNKHMYILSTAKEFGENPITDEQKENNPLLAETDIKDTNGKNLLVNDVFRFVHDFFGHAKLGNQFGPIGEETAWNVHSKMYSDEARKAMTTETRGQNSFVNFGKHMRNKEGKIIKKGEEGYLGPKERPFAEQKIGLLPDWIVSGGKSYESDMIPAEKAVHDDLKQELETNYEKNKKQYLEKNGTIFDTDRAREFSSEYNKNPELLSNATQVPAREFVNKMYKEELAKPAPEGKENVVVFTAGGSGVGKSRAVENLKLNHQITVDTNLSNFERGVKDIQEALDAGKKVNIFFTYRDPVKAFTSDKGGVITRAKRIGRTVPYDIATEINKKALATIVKLSEHFKDNPNVHFAYFNNSFNKGEAKPMTLESVKKLKPDFEAAKKTIKDEIERQYKDGQLNEKLYAGLIGDTKKLQEILGGMESEGGQGISGSSQQPGQRFSFNPESGVGKQIRDFIKGRLEAGIPEEKIKDYLKQKAKLSDKYISDAFKSAKEAPKPEPEKKEPVRETQTEPKTEQEKKKAKFTEEGKSRFLDVNGKIVDLARVPVSDRIKTVLGRVFNDPEAPQTLIDALTNRFGSREQMLKSKRYSQKEARELGGEIVKAFENLNDAIDFATNKGYEIDGDIQLAILDNVLNSAYDAEKKSTITADREYYQQIQAKALDEIASIGEQSGRRISYYNMMYNVNPQIFGQKMFESIGKMNEAILEKKIGDASKTANEKIDQFSKESRDIVNREKKTAADNFKTDFSGPKYQAPKTNKTQAEIDKIRKSRNAKMEAIKKKLKGDTKGPNESFSFEEPESTPLDQERLSAIKDIGDTFIEEGYLTYAQWSRKVENEFKSAGIPVYGKELQEVWGQSQDKVSDEIKSAYKNLSKEEIQSLIEAQASAKVKELPLAIKGILADSNVSKDMKDKIKQRLMNELGLSEGYASNITDSFMKEFETQAKKQVESRLKQIKNASFISSFKKPNKAAEERIVNDVISGTYESSDLKPSFYEMYGMQDADKVNGLKDRLVELSQKVATQKEGSLMKDKALRDLYNEIQKYKPTSAFQVGTDVYYSSLLSGYETHIKNFALFNALQTYVNKPMQIALQNILSGNKSKAATAIYSKNLAKMMYNEAKGIVLTGNNAFYDKPHEQSAMEGFVKKAGNNPLKTLWRYAHLPTRFLSAEDAFGTVGLSDIKARQLMYDKIKKEMSDKGEQIIPEQINQQVNKALGYTKESMDAAKVNAEQSLKNYYGDDFNLQKELAKKPQNTQEKLRKERIKTEYNREIYRSLVNNRDTEITDQAVSWAKNALLQNDPEGTLGRVYVGMNTLIQQLPALRVFLPFLKVPLNITNNLIQSTPGTSYIRLLTGRKGTFGGQKMSRQEYVEHRQKAMTYTFLTAALMALQEGLRDEEGNPFFYVTGKNGQSYTESSAREAAGKDQPYTVYVGGKPILKYQYSPWMPLFASLGIANDIRLENNGEIPEGKQVSDIAANAFLKYANTINEQAALKGVNEVLNTVQEAYDKFLKGEGDFAGNLKEFVGKKAASVAKTLLIPNAATQANTDIKAMFDADRIATTSFADDIIKDMPLVDIVSQQFFGNESKIDVLGRPLKEKLSVAGYSALGDDEYYKMFVDKHYLPFAYNKRVLKVNTESEDGEIKVIERPLSLEERYKANLMRGKMLLEYMTENKEALQEMDDATFQGTLKSQIRAFDNQVESELFGAESE